MKILRTASLGSNFTGSYKKRVYSLIMYWLIIFLATPSCTVIERKQALVLKLLMKKFAYF